jgi:hypothetical protein
MSGIRDVLIRGSEKIIGHYRLLLLGAKNEEERELYRRRIEREQRLLVELHGGFPSRFATRPVGAARIASLRSTSC